ncbi:MAG: STAS domain-containing protein [Alphaproteobacteria bacterium]|nr:STAS domain-containing protein [Alphaproteobacteria bacterium]
MAGDVSIIRLTGRLDSSTARAAEDNFSKLLAGEFPSLALDLTMLDYVSSAGLRVLLVVAKKLQRANAKLVLFGMHPSVREVFAISGFDKIFAIQPDQAAALAAVR